MPALLRNAGGHAALASVPVPALAGALHDRGRNRRASAPAPLGPLCMGPSLAQLATQAPTRAVDGDHLREMKQAIEDQAALFTLALALAFLIPSAGRHPWPAVAVLYRRPYQRSASALNS